MMNSGKHIFIDSAFTFLIILLLLMGTTSCKDRGTWSKLSDPPAETGSVQPSLRFDRDGRLWISWISRLDSVQNLLKHTLYNGTSWSEPQTITTVENIVTSGPDIPTFVTFPDGRLAGQYPVEKPSHWGATGIRIIQETRSGEWQQPSIPHSDSSATEHGFTSIVPLENNHLLAVWLDGRNRNTAHEVEAKSNMESTELYGAFIDPAGNVENEISLDTRVCDCCPTAAVRTPKGVLIAYRDRSEDEIRDISLINFDGERWSEPYRVHDDGWQINACPVNGPALAANGKRVALAWYTMDDNTARIKIAFSRDSGIHFTDPVLLDSGSGVRGQIDLVLNNDGAAFVSWRRVQNGQSTVRIQRVPVDGLPGKAVDIELNSPAVFSRPQLAGNGRNVVLGWSDADSAGIQVAHFTEADFR